MGPPAAPATLATAFLQPFSPACSQPHKSRKLLRQRQQRRQQRQGRCHEEGGRLRPESGGRGRDQAPPRALEHTPFRSPFRSREKMGAVRLVCVG